MGIQYYAFALFVSGLICLIAILCKVLFADVRRQRRLLDERESKLLRLYQTVEDIMEELSSQITEAKEDIRKQQDILAAREASLRSAVPKQEPDEITMPSAAVYNHHETFSQAAPYAPYAQVQDAQRIRQRAASEAVDSFRLKPAAEWQPSGDFRRRQNVNGVPDGIISFQKMIDDTVEERMPGGAKLGRNESILMLQGEGKSVPQIARELGITQNEVKLVIGLNS